MASLWRDGARRRKCAAAWLARYARPRDTAAPVTMILSLIAPPGALDRRPRGALAAAPAARRAWLAPGEACDLAAGRR